MSALENAKNWQLALAVHLDGFVPVGERHEGGEHLSRRQKCLATFGNIGQAASFENQG